MKIMNPLTNLLSVVFNSVSLCKSVVLSFFHVRVILFYYESHRIVQYLMHAMYRYLYMYA